MQSADNMNQHLCRSCKSQLPPTPELQYSNMPSVAQLFSTEKESAITQSAQLSIYQCSSCGLIQLSANSLVPYYKDVIRSSSVSQEMMAYREHQFSEFSGKYQLNDKSYIELGCGRGEYLSIVSRYIKLAIGLEHRQESVSSCLLRGLNVVSGYLQDMPDLDQYKPFDSFGIYNYLEHIPDVTGYLRSLRQYLAPNAPGLVEVPNFDVMVENSVYADFSAEHLSYFTEESLTTALALSGFRVLSVTSTWHRHILTAEVVNRETINLKPFISKLQEDRNIIGSLLESFHPSEVVVWGAGHQSLAFISQLSLVDKVGYIVDSSPDKQHKYAPGLGLPILPPEAIHTLRPELLIINASSYNSEVAHIVSREYNLVPLVFAIDNGTLQKLH